MTNDGAPYGPYRFKQIVKECYILAKNCNLSYKDLMDMTPTERIYMLEFLSEEIKRSKELIDQKQK